jgi:uncharacterized protein YfdQ (DUF2303 family)
MSSETTDTTQTLDEPVLMEVQFEPREMPARMPDSGEGIQAIIKLANEASEIDVFELPTAGLGDGLPETVPLLIDRRPGQKAPDLKQALESFRLRPARRAGTAHVTTLQSFIDLTRRYTDADTSALFGDVTFPGPKLTAIIDYNAKGFDAAPNHLQHRILYPFPVTEELKTWMAMNEKPMGQVDFAQFIEDHIAELSAPFDGERQEYEPMFREKFATPADLLSLSRELEIHVNSKVKQGVRLSSGERTVEFLEEHSNAKTGDPVAIPGIFMVAVRAFEDGEVVRIPARLRYRAGGGSISWFYSLYRLDFWLKTQVRNDLEKAAKETGLPSFEGAPEV